MYTRLLACDQASVVIQVSGGISGYPGCSGTELLFIFSLRLKSHIYLRAKHRPAFVGRCRPGGPKISTVPTQRQTPPGTVGTALARTLITPMHEAKLSVLSQSNLSFWPFHDTRAMLCCHAYGTAQSKIPHFVCWFCSQFRGLGNGPFYCSFNENYFWTIQRIG